jgi:hypothetical protein
MTEVRKKLRQYMMTKFWKEIRNNMRKQIDNKMKMDVMKDMRRTRVQVIQILQEDVGINGEELNVIFNMMITFSLQKVGL